MPKTLNDVVILGRAAPEEMSRGGQTSCTGAWSKHRGFIRLYPCSPEENLFSRWDIIEAEVKRNKNDNRPESWKLAARDHSACIEKIGTFPDDQKPVLLRNIEDECVFDIREVGRSLGVIRPKSINLKLQPWGDEESDTEQSVLFEEMEEWTPLNRDEFEQEIRIRFECENCKTKQGYHNKTLLEWGGYMALENNEINSGEELESFYSLNDDKYKHWIFVGNQNNKRTAYIAISLISKKDDGTAQKPLGMSYPKTPDNFEHPGEKG